MKSGTSDPDAIFSLWITYIMHVWTISHKIKPRNEKKQVYFMPKTPSWGLRSFWSSKYEILKSFWWLVKWSLRRRFELIIRAKHRFCTDGPRPQIKAFVDKFWRVFLISSLYFALNRPEMHFLFKFKIAKWSLRSKFELEFRAHIRFEPQNDARPQAKTSLEICWRVLFIYGLYFTQIRSETHF